MMDDSDDMTLRMRSRELVQRYLLGAAGPDEVSELEAILTRSRAARDDFRRGCYIDSALRQAAARLSSSPAAAPPPVPPARRAGWFGPWFSRRSLASMAAGLAVGVCCASAVWATSSSHETTVQLVSAITDRGFGPHVGRLPRGFPVRPEVWSGDEAEIVEGRTVGGAFSPRVLQFLEPGSDENDPSGRAVSCDVFQLIDLRRPLRSVRAGDEVVLEITTRFLDDRPANSSPTVTFIAKIYLFAGDPAALHRVWPQANLEAVASGVSEVTTAGGEAPDWRTVTARCLVHRDADFAVVQLAARPNLRPSAPRNLFADDVRVAVRVTPPLPVRVVEN